MATVQAHNPQPAFGVAAGWAILHMTPQQLNAYMASIKALGVRWVRLDVDWAQVQPKATSYNWQSYDNVFAAAHANGLQTLGILDYTPSWAVAPGCVVADRTKCQPNVNAYAAFAAAASARYVPGGAHAWEIWNEPNWPRFWAPVPNPDVYAQLLKSSSAAIRRQDPKATIVLGGLSALGTVANNIPAATFLEDLYDDDAGDSFDAVAMHAYTYPYLPSDAQHAPSWQQLYQLYAVMQAHGDGDKKVWITEFGAPTDGPGPIANHAGMAQPNRVDHVNETVQAQILTDAVQQYKTLPFAGPFFWYAFEDVADPAHTTTEDFYGLLRSDGTHKPAYSAYQKAMAP